MLVRIRLELPRRRPRSRARRARALRLSSWLKPASFASVAVAVWQLGADLDWTGGYALPHGLFSHWQVWMGMAVSLQVIAGSLNRFGRGDGAAMS